MWKLRINKILGDNPKPNKQQFLQSVLQQIERYGESAAVPSDAQIRIIAPMWRSYEKKQLANILGDDALTEIAV